jgi:hypothetical protein
MATPNTPPNTTVDALQSATTAPILPAANVAEATATAENQVRNVSPQL